MPPIRVQLVCDQQMLADALRVRLAREPDGFVLSHRRSSDERLAAAVHARQPDLLLVDARSVSGHWATLVDTLVEAAPRARVAVMSATTDPADAVSAARRCLSAWLHPQVTADHLVDVLRVVSDGHTVYPSSVLGDVLRRFAAELRRTATGSGPLAHLTDRERQVLTAWSRAGGVGRSPTSSTCRRTPSARTPTGSSASWVPTIGSKPCGSRGGAGSSCGHPEHRNPRAPHRPPPRRPSGFAWSRTASSRDV